MISGEWFWEKVGLVTSDCDDMISMGENTCHYDILDKGGVDKDRPHPRHPFTTPHPTVYKIGCASRTRFWWMKLWLT